VEIDLLVTTRAHARRFHGRRAIPAAASVHGGEPPFRLPARGLFPRHHPVRRSARLPRPGNPLASALTSGHRTFRLRCRGQGEGDLGPAMAPDPGVGLLRRPVHPPFGRGRGADRHVPGTNGGYGDVIIHADYTHSLIGAILISVATGWIATRWWGKRGGVVIG